MVLKYAELFHICPKSEDLQKKHLTMFAGVFQN